MADSQIAIRTMRGIQQPFLLPALAPRLAPFEPKGVVYTNAGSSSCCLILRATPPAPISSMPSPSSLLPATEPFLA